MRISARLRDGLHYVLHAQPQQVGWKSWCQAALQSVGIHDMFSSRRVVPRWVERWTGANSSWTRIIFDWGVEGNAEPRLDHERIAMKAPTPIISDLWTRNMKQHLQQHLFMVAVCGLGRCWTHWLHAHQASSLRSAYAGNQLNNLVLNRCLTLFLWTGKIDVDPIDVGWRVMDTSATHGRHILTCIVASLALMPDVRNVWALDIFGPGFRICSRMLFDGFSLAMRNLCANFLLSSTVSLTFFFAAELQICGFWFLKTRDFWNLLNLLNET